MNIKFPEEVWLAGKGKSIDTYNWKKAGWCRIGINEAAFIVPGCNMAICLDYAIHDKYKKQLNPRTLVLCKQAHKNYVVYPYCLYYETGGIDITQGYSTATVAIELLSKLSVKIIHFVGFDSMDGGDTANSILKIDGKGTNNDGYKSINGKILEVLTLTGITPVWEHKDENSNIGDNVQ